MGKKVTADQDELELKHTVRKIYLSFGMFLLSGILFYFGESRGANSTLEIILCLPICVLGIVILLFLAFVCLVPGAEEFAKEKGDTRGAKIACAGCAFFIVLAVLAAYFGLFRLARDLIASFDPPSIELTQLCAEYHPGETGSTSDYRPSSDTPDELNLFGVDSDGKEHEFNIDKDEWYRLTEVGKKDYVTSEESDYWIIEFDEEARLICKYLPSGSLVDFEIIE